MARTWRFAPHDPVVVARLSRDLGCSPLLAAVIAARGYETGGAARAFLKADLHDLHEPALLPGIDEAADRIVAAIRAGRRITIYGDYDVDGVTATSILWHCVRLAGGNVDYYIPSRLDEGYGLHCEALRTLHAEDPQRLVVTVDCGIASVAEAALAAELGLELIVTDHHNFTAHLPAATVLVHPRLPGTQYPFADLCGAGVAFKLAWAVCQRLGDGAKASPRMREFLISAVGLAALGTVADVVPLQGENRVLVSHGLRVLHKPQGPGLEALKKIAGLEDAARLSAEDLAFGLSPRLNAAGRLGQARLAVELLTTDNHARAAGLAEYIDQLNRNRQTVERRIFRQAREQAAEDDGREDRPALVLAHAEWHPGVIGIVASRIAEHFERPAVLIALNQQEGIGHGSGRTFADFDLHAGLAACAAHLESFGGHRAAAGLRVRIDRIDGFRDSLASYIREHHRPGVRDAELRIDAEVALADLTPRAVHELERLGPFGAQNRRPVFAAAGVRLVEPPQTMGNGDRHLALRVRQSGQVFRAVAFGKADWAAPLSALDGPVALCFEASINTFGGYERVELRLIDWRTDSAPAHTEIARVAGSLA